MNTKQVFMTGTIVGTFVGGLVPLLWGDSYLSFASVLFTALGGIAGLYVAYKISR